MRTYKFSLPLSALLLLVACNASARQLPSAIATDPPPDKDFPASMEAPDIRATAPG